ncbi:hypothetical protein PtA15_1A699 [Puccinia triticina]|nr:uncharacterized protein PtA15_1A699 [Puccinia triticina]WAQ81359.1 hypothetical protein PtA15_1A699 [Puccinia triticina]WAR52240.1 hypothetical protein PtB15_1B681 [Puccinia triticina]
MIHRNLPNGLLEHNQPAAILSSGSAMSIQPSANSTALMPNFLIPRYRSRPPTAEETSLRLAWLGYRQELSRNWGFWSSFSLSYINLGKVMIPDDVSNFLSLTCRVGPFFRLLTFSGATQGTFWAYQTIYILGGPVTMFWGTILIGTVMLIQYMVLAELASAYPAAGAMFTWTFKLAHSNARTKNWANFLSWTVAMYLFVSHIIFQMEDSWQLALIVQKLIRLVFPHWKAGNWHLYMISCVNLIVTGAFMLLPVSRSPRLWISFAALTACISATICVLLLASSNFHQSPIMIFTRLENRSQFQSNGVAFMLGASILAAAGAENSAHMAEETHQAELVVPRAMFFATVINYINVLIVQICFYMSFSEANIFNQPAMLSLVLSHCSRRVSACIFSCLLVVTWIQQISQLFASTRFVWALARDNAFPFATLWRKLSKSQMPRRATILLVALTILASCFLGVSQTHVTTFIERSDSYLSLMCYLIPIVLYLLSDKDVLYRDGRNFWTLQEWSRPLAWLALITLLIQMVLGGFPTEARAAGPQFLARAVSSASIPLVALLAAVSWFLYGRAHYVGPIKSITVWTTGQEVELPRAGNCAISNPTSTEEAVGRRANIYEESIPMQATSGSLPRGENLTSASPSTSRINSVTIPAYASTSINSIEGPEI